MLPRTLTLILNDACPLRCAHCSIGFGSKHHGSRLTMEESLVRSTARNARAAGFEMLVLAGGEPSLQPTLISIAASEGRAYGVLSSLVTAPVWARSEETAHAFFEKIVAPDFLVLSVDRYHLDQLPWANYQHAALVSKKLQIQVGVNLCTANEQEQKQLETMCRERIPQLDFVYGSRVIAKAGGSTLVQIEDGRSAGFDLSRPSFMERTCTIGNAVVNLDGTFHACCWSGGIPHSRLRFGTAHDLIASSETMRDDPLFIRIKKSGFFAALSSDIRNTIGKRVKAGATECSVCMRAMEDDVLPELVGVPRESLIAAHREVRPRVDRLDV